MYDSPAFPLATVIPSAPQPSEPFQKMKNMKINHLQCKAGLEGVGLDLLSTLTCTSAPDSRRKDAISTFPFNAATISAVAPSWKENILWVSAQKNTLFHYLGLNLVLRF